MRQMLCFGDFSQGRVIAFLVLRAFFLLVASYYIFTLGVSQKTLHTRFTTKIPYILVELIDQYE